MYGTVTSGTIYGIESRMIQVEVDISPGMPCFQIVGLPGSEVREARERVKVALKNAGVELPSICINVNLSPADIPKSGTLFDLPVAVGIMAALSRVDRGALDGTLLIGELSLSGEVKPVRGVLPIVRAAAAAGIRRCILPARSAWEGTLVEGVESIPVENLKQAVDLLNGTAKPPDAPQLAESENNNCYGNGEDFADISGQEGLKRAAEVAAAGFHNLLVIGTPGSGKTMLARRIPTILPPMSTEESLEVSSIYSILGLLRSTGSLKKERPFLNPHHTITGQALTGGGRIPAPGIISQAHRGVLFLDELPEFKRQTLDTLRQPLEDRQVQIARSSGNYIYPADFMLVAAMNPCPCGYYPDPGRCRCTRNEVRRYLRRVSGPILDRMDICVEAQPVEFKDIARHKPAEDSAVIRARVLAARQIQTDRFAGTNVRFNADMKASDVERFCGLGRKERLYMEKMFAAMHLSARGYHKILKVARTIADLEQSDAVTENHLAEAICYRHMEVFEV